MARNEEKAQAMLNRWWSMKRSLTTKPLETRPSLSQEVNSINECEKWRYFNSTKQLLFFKFLIFCSQASK